MQIITKFFVIAMAFMTVILFSAEAGAEKKIGILKWTSEDHYSEALGEIMKQLKKEGFGEPNAKFITENAEGNKLKAMESARKFADAGMDLVIALGTVAAIAATKEIKDVPIVFSWVYDPVDASIVQDWKSSGNNATGSSSKYPMRAALKTLKELAPVKRLAVMYTPGDKVTESQLKELLAAQGEFQIKVLPIIIDLKAEGARMVSIVAGEVDAFFLAGGAQVGELVPEIVDIANKAKIITVGTTEARLGKGVLLVVCASSYSLGVMAGERAVKVLKGVKPSSLPIGTMKKPDVMLNMKTVKAIQLKVPPEFMKLVTKTIE
jgi:putative ABC transport system substrate-binding protein